MEIASAVHEHIKSTSVVVRLSEASRSEWDDFAAKCGASFRGSYLASRTWQFDHHFVYRLRRLACFLDGVKIAQAAIGMGMQSRVFAEGLQLLPEYTSLWGHVMAAVLCYLGDGEYHYGSSWSLEPPRERDLASIPGVTITSTKAITVYSVDLARWNCWDAYYKELSTNAKRNAKRAERVFTKLVITSRFGLASLQDFYWLMKLRQKLYRRKRIGGMSWSKLTTRFLLRIITLGQRCFLVVARADGTAASAFGGIVFGDNTYYLESGSLKDNKGASWYLLLHVLRGAYERAPQGRFVTGFYRENSEKDAGLDFFRVQCNAVGHPTSEVVFSYDAGRGSMSC